MASLVLSGDTSGSITVSAPAVAGSTTQTLVNVTGTLAPIVSGTAVTLTTQTNVDFTGIPSWVKRITVMFSGVSTSGTSNIQVQIGSGSVTTSGYVSGSSIGTTYTTATTGFLVYNSTTSSDVISGLFTISNITGNTWVEGGTLNNSGATRVSGGNSPSLSGALDRVRITTVNGTDTFDAGTINIIYE